MIIMRGHLGFGDCLHQRAIVRTLMDAGEDVILETFYVNMYHDLVERGLRLQPIAGHPPRVREQGRFTRAIASRAGNAGARHARLTYNAATVHRHGSILGAQYACCGLTMPERPDFNMPVPDEWRGAARARLGRSDKPLMVYRPTVLNDMFHCEQRLPDIASYAALYESVRDRYHVVSLCNLGNCNEHIAGPEMPADVKFHHGELPFEELAGLYAEADVAFTCAGYAPVLAQAVGTRTVIVYGGHEGYRTTNSVGAHLAPTLAIEAVNQCECHGGHYSRGPDGGLVKPSRDHECDKTLDVPSALRQLQMFLEDAHADA